jgi:hypothetical protein
MCENSSNLVTLPDQRNSKAGRRFPLRHCQPESRRERKPFFKKKKSFEINIFPLEETTADAETQIQVWGPSNETRSPCKLMASIEFAFLNI